MKFGLDQLIHFFDDFYSLHLFIYKIDLVKLMINNYTIYVLIIYNVYILQGPAKRL